MWGYCRFDQRKFWPHAALWIGLTLALDSFPLVAQEGWLPARQLPARQVPASQIRGEGDSIFEPNSESRGNQDLAETRHLSLPTHALVSGAESHNGVLPSEPRSLAPVATAGLKELPTPNFQLSHADGQVWREYDIRVYTQRIVDREHPEQVIVDWILRETGTDAWFGGSPRLLSASRDKIQVYAPPELQRVVAEIVDRFTTRRSEAHELVVHVVTVSSPDWRLRALPFLQRVSVQTPGVEAWTMSRENAALLLAELGRRTDFREHNTPNLTIFNGQTHLISSTRPRTYVQGPATNDRPLTMPYGSGLSQIQEGFTLKLSPLVSVDGTMMEVVVDCQVDQVERFATLWAETKDDIGSGAGGGERDLGWGGSNSGQIQVPQIASWRLHERFRWRMNEVLLISRGVVATPVPVTRSMNPLARLRDGGGERAEALLFLESRRELRASQPVAETARGAASVYRGRY